VPHHLAHAASAFYPGLEESLILVSDGMGEVHSMTVPWDKDGNKNFEAGAGVSFPGNFIRRFTLHLGFYMNMDEYKVMGSRRMANPRRHSTR